ncbi:simple sugar transport system substrate-binding protein [Paenibacillus phyllosphaerae]|uniref:Simple sugar transport system substrate-binding protein n=1 Tax=Paenibacillus phyllosphaerae TaxID=274593 RepID=A0A7W5FQ59_9BACL|nr:simple sugar transport system substrate-binding protein [Paenibacillus phyllosphaerae]
MVVNMRWYCFMLLVVLLQGCTGGASPTAPIVSDSTKAPSEVHPVPLQSVVPDAGDPIVVGFSQLGSESKWREANTASIVEAAKEAGIQLHLQNAEQSQKRQFAAIRSFVAQQVDVIVIAPVIQTGWDAILQEVKQAGIPVIMLDRAVEVTDSSLYVTLIGPDFYEEGVKAAKYVIDKMRNHEGPVRIAELAGTVGSTPSIDRGRGFRDTIASQTDLVIAQSMPADFTTTQGEVVMSQFLSGPKEQWPDVLFAHNDDMAIGALKAIEQAGLKPGEDIIIVSVDGTRKAFEQMVAGKINAVVECNPLLGPQLVQAVSEIMAGRMLPKRMVPPEDIFTQEMAASELESRKY